MSRRREKPAPEQQIRVLLVDDHVSFRDAAATVFEQEGYEVVGQVGTLAEAHELIDVGALAADVAMVDLDLPDGDGSDLIAEMHETNPQTQVLVLSATLDRAEMARAVESGAAGFLHKSAGMNEVLDTIRRLLAGEALLAPEEVIELLRLSASHRARSQQTHEVINRLTPREREVLEALAEGLDGKEIALRLRISDKTERNHVANIMIKFGVHSRLQVLVFALRHRVIDIGVIA